MFQDDGASRRRGPGVSAGLGLGRAARRAPNRMPARHAVKTHSLFGLILYALARRPIELDRAYRWRAKQGWLTGTRRHVRLLVATGDRRRGT
jgi:hypothetical protein